MADEILKRDQNRVTVLAGITDDANEDITMLRVDPTTKRLLVTATVSGIGTVTDVSVVTANGFAGSVATSTTTPAITLSTTITGLLQGNGTAISAVTIGSGLDFTGGTLSATGGGVPTSITVANEATDTSCFIAFFTAATGDLEPKTNANLTFDSSTGVLTLGQTASASITGNAGTATALQTARTIGGVSFDGTGNITVASATGGFTVSGGDLALGTNSITMTGSIAATGSRVTKGWFTDIESTNAPTVGGSAVYYAGGTDVAVADGGTGRSSHTEYAVICGGTTTTGAQQSIASVGTSGQVLTSNGAGALPTFQDAAGGGGSFQYVNTFTATGQNSISCTSLDLDTDTKYKFIVKWYIASLNSSTDIVMTMNSDTGGNYGYAFNGYQRVSDTNQDYQGAGENTSNIKLCDAYGAGQFELLLWQFTDGSNEWKLISGTGTLIQPQATGQAREVTAINNSGVWAATANVTSVQFDIDGTADTANWEVVIYKLINS